MVLFPSAIVLPCFFDARACILSCLSKHMNLIQHTYLQPWNQHAYMTDGNTPDERHGVPPDGHAPADDHAPAGP